MKVKKIIKEKKSAIIIVLVLAGILLYTGRLEGILGSLGIGVPCTLVGNTETCDLKYLGCHTQIATAGYTQQTYSFPDVTTCSIQISDTTYVTTGTCTVSGTQQTVRINLNQNGINSCQSTQEIYIHENVKYGTLTLDHSTTPPCQNQCVLGVNRCSVSGDVEQCKDGNGDGCFEWVSLETCTNGCTSGSCNAPVTTIPGTTTWLHHFYVKEQGSGTTINGATIDIQGGIVGSSGIRTKTTDANGYAVYSLGQDYTYTITVSKDGYVTQTFTDYQSAAVETTAITLIPTGSQDIYWLYNIYVKENGGPVLEGATVYVTGDPIGSTGIRQKTTDANGYAVYSLAEGHTYDVTVSKSGYETKTYSEYISASVETINVLLIKSTTTSTPTTSTTTTTLPVQTTSTLIGTCEPVITRACDPATSIIKDYLSTCIPTGWTTDLTRCGIPVTYTTTTTIQGQVFVPFVCGNNVCEIGELGCPIDCKMGDKDITPTDPCKELSGIKGLACSLKVAERDLILGIIAGVAVIGGIGYMSGFWKKGKRR